MHLIYTVYMDVVLGLEKINDACGKTMHTGTMDRGFTVVMYVPCSLHKTIQNICHDNKSDTSCRHGLAVQLPGRNRVSRMWQGYKGVWEGVGGKEALFSSGNTSLLVASFPLLIMFLIYLLPAS
jgi:hypothetical protein